MNALHYVVSKEKTQNEPKLNFRTMHSIIERQNLETEKRVQYHIPPELNYRP